MLILSGHVCPSVDKISINQNIGSVKVEHSYLGLTKVKIKCFFIILEHILASQMHGLKVIAISFSTSTTIWFWTQFPHAQFFWYFFFQTPFFNAHRTKNCLQQKKKRDRGRTRTTTELMIWRKKIGQMQIDIVWGLFKIYWGASVIFGFGIPPFVSGAHTVQVI